MNHRSAWVHSSCVHRNQSFVSASLSFQQSRERSIAESRKQARFKSRVMFLLELQLYACRRRLHVSQVLETEGKLPNCQRMSRCSVQCVSLQTRILCPTGFAQGKAFLRTTEHMSLSHVCLDNAMLEKTKRLPSLCLCRMKGEMHALQGTRVSISGKLLM